MHIKLFSALPSLNNYEVKFSRWHFMAFKFFLHVNAILRYSVLRKFASSPNLINQSEREWNNCEKVSKTENRIFAADTCVVA